MKNKLFKYYKDCASNYALIYVHMNLYHKFFYSYIIFTILLLISVIPAYFLLQNLTSYIIMWILILVCVGSVILFSKMFDVKSMRILKKQYGISSTPKTWDDYTLEIRIHIITEYLIEHGLYERWKIEKLIDDFYKDEEKAKIPPLVAPSIILAISIPNVTQLLLQIYSFFNLEANVPYFVQNSESAKLTLNVSIFFVVLIVSLILVMSISVINHVQAAMRKAVFDKHGQKRNGLIETLENVLYQMQDRMNI
ncbi:hypothetical protein SAMN05720606_10617 [Paenibacillus polysaccharolyticus]|uniref:Uncharacterized protein n=1 Tax=Paenibacillus polysaccharolyticus TaxID=582692 RepID=A0A1G5GUR6_9BACL|nr:hypothetical protein [Paenibacillus polysaccharolyticus]SCY54368.1 hypothetical protein SAMN05720606_10617 [Paenibacillus polysaccharolyticus]